MRSVVPFLIAALAALLSAAGCDGDPANVAEAPRYVWVNSSAKVEDFRGLKVGIRGSGYAFALKPPERAGMDKEVVLFRDSTMRDTIGVVSSRSLGTVNPLAEPVRPGDSIWGPLETYLSDEQILVRAEQAGRRTRIGHVACDSEQALGWWTKMTELGKLAERDSAHRRDAQCVRLRGGLLVTVIDTAAAGRLHVRIYPESRPLRVWMDSAAIGPAR
jgi:hypothetical protein